MVETPARAVLSPAGRSAYPRRNRLLHPPEFAAVLSHRWLIRTPHLALHFHRREPSEGPWRLGLIVPKRFEKRATRRNLVKRVIRNRVRQISQTLAGIDASSFSGWDVVVRLLAPLPDRIPTDVRAQLQQELDTVLARLGREIAR